MAQVRIKYTSRILLPSCKAGESELSVGEEVILELKPKNTLWPDKIKATVACVTPGLHGRTYTFEYDDSVLNGGPEPEICDVNTIRCYSCCDAIRDELTESGIILGAPPARIGIYYTKIGIDGTSHWHYTNPSWQPDGSAVVQFSAPDEFPPIPQYTINLLWQNGTITVTSTAPATIPVIAIVNNILG